MAPAHGKHFLKFGAHTILKHLVLSGYVKTWAAKLSLDGRNRPHLLLVDAFAGSGGDDIGNPGSPLIMIDSASAIAQAVARHREKPRIDVVLIERHSKRRAQLAERVRQLSEGTQRYIQVLPGTLADHATALLAQHPESPMVIFLDPFGVRGLEMDLIRAVLDGPNREVFIQFNARGASRLAATIGASAPKREASLRAQSQVLDLFKTPEETNAEVALAVQRAREGLEATKRTAESLLTRVYGRSSTVDRLRAATSPEGRLRASIELYEEELVSIGVSYLTRLPIFNDGCRLQYVLLHASRHPKGRQAMKECFGAALVKSSLPDEARRLMQAEARGDERAAAVALRQRFGGQTCTWAKRQEDSVADFLLQETDLFPWQLNVIRKTMEDCGWKLPGTPWRYHIAPLGSSD